MKAIKIGAKSERVKIFLIRDDNWITDEDPGFIDAENGNFLLKEAAKVFEKIPEFQSIPFDKIGVNKNLK